MGIYAGKITNWSQIDKRLSGKIKPFQRNQGSGSQTMLEKIIYIADYVERNRSFPGVEEMRAMAYTDLDKAVLMGLQSAVAHVRRQGQGLAPATMEALEFLQNQK